MLREIRNYCSSEMALERRSTKEITGMPILGEIWHNGQQEESVRPKDDMNTRVGLAMLN